MGRFECIDPSFLWKEVPAGRRLGVQSGVKDDANGKTFLHKSLLTKAPERRSALIFIKGDARKWWGQRYGGNAFPTYGEANPVSLRQAAPSRGRDENVGHFECIDPSFLWKEVPAGRRLGRRAE